MDLPGRNNLLMVIGFFSWYGRLFVGAE